MLKRPSRKAAASEEARRTLRYVEPLSDARTPLDGLFQHPIRRYSGEVAAMRSSKNTCLADLFMNGET